MESRIQRGKNEKRLRLNFVNVNSNMTQIVKCKLFPNAHKQRMVQNIHKPNANNNCN